MTDTDRDKLRATLIFAEGIRLKPYTDTVGKLTVGVGRNLDDVGLALDEVYYLLANDLKRVEREATKAWPWLDDLDPVRQRVVLEMVFQLGLAGVQGFKRFLAYLEDGRYAQAADQMLASKWAQQTPTRAQRLAQMMRSGKDA